MLSYFTITWFLCIWMGVFSICIRDFLVLWNHSSSLMIMKFLWSTFNGWLKDQKEEILFSDQQDKLYSIEKEKSKSFNSFTFTNIFLMIIQFKEVDSLLRIKMVLFVRFLKPRSYWEKMNYQVYQQISTLDVPQHLVITLVL